jgi:hypothetical protein
MSHHLGPDEVETAEDTNPHLAECQKCREAVRLARGRQKLLKGMRPYTLSDVGFSRVDARLVEHVREGPRSGFKWLWAAVAVSAAAAVAAFVLSAVPKPVAPPAAFEPMTVTFASGNTSLKAGEVLGRGALVNADGADVMLSTADGESLRLSGGASFQLGLRDAVVALDSGRLAVDAARGGPWVIRAGKHWVETADALMLVSPNTVDLSRGSVRVFDEATLRRGRTLPAPAHLDLETGMVGPLTADLGAPPRAVKPPWARLVLGLKSDEVSLDGQKLGPSPLSTLTTPGRHHVSAAGREVDVDLTTSGSGIVELPEKAVVAPPAMPKGPHVEADPDAIAKAIRAQLPKLRVCHDKWLKVDASARGKVEMALTVSPQGKVVKTSFTADEGVPAAIDDCLARAARTLVLPKSSEEVELELPVVLGGN